jgi:putative two-component system response regulator
MPLNGAHAQAGGPARVLVVDADERAASTLTGILRDAGYAVGTAVDTIEARRRLADESFAALIVDVEPPGEAGLQLVKHAHAEHPDVSALMVAGADRDDLARAAMDLGTHGYIVKPFTANEIMFAVANACRRRELEMDNRAHQEALEQIVRARTTALERSAKQLKLTREEMVRRLSRAVEYRDEETGGHTERMSRYCALLAGRAGLDAESLRIASPMHDVGKVAIPDHILLKPGRLTPPERAEMERHTVIGHEILSGSRSALLELAAQIALTHHEKFDGTGYPRRLAGSDIPLEGRVAAIADVFDALTSERSYRPALPLEQTLEIMRAERGQHFDPGLLDLFLDSMDNVLEIRAAWPDSSADVAAAVRT